MAITPATLLGLAKPSPMAGDILANSEKSASAGMPGVLVMPEAMLPGATATARRPCLAYSDAIVWVNDWIPPLEAA
ncbi:hypothetical protein D3C87_2132380 [compost metagenome]